MVDSELRILPANDSFLIQALCMIYAKGAAFRKFCISDRAKTILTCIIKLASWASSRPPSGLDSIAPNTEQDRPFYLHNTALTFSPVRLVEG